MADFQTLINLIQQTIDPDNWQAVGGGTSTILEYPSGVYVDPVGRLQRVERSESLTGNLVVSSQRPMHPWRSSSGQRTISLKALDKAVAKANASGLRPTAEMLSLAGLSRIAFVKIDASNEDILLSGPAGDSAHGFQLVDLATVAALVNTTTQPIGCSIEPTQAGLLAAQQMLSDPNTVSRLGRSPKVVVQQLQERMGPHAVHVFGISPNTTTAIALVDADEHMKRVGFGTVAVPVRMNSYFDWLEQQADVPKQSMIRWWFAYADEPIRASVQNDLFQLPERCVAVMSEQQWFSAQGRAPTGGNDMAADAFARSMTENLPVLRQSHSSYARLCGVFESSLGLQLAVEATGQPSLEAWFPNLCSLGRAEDVQLNAPQTVEGLTTWHRLKGGTIVAAVSGGVKMDVKALAAREKWQAAQHLASSSVPVQAAVPSTVHGNWWWD